MPRPLVFTPEDLGGVGLTSINTKQGLDHVQAVVHHLCDDTTTGPFMTILLQTSQMISAFSQDIFLHPHLDLYFMKEFKQKWVCKIQSTLASAGAKLHLINHWVPSFNHDYDQALMEAFSDLHFFSWELEQLNCYHVFLQVTFVSEICNAAKDKIVPECYFQPTQHFCWSNLVWLEQKSPGAFQ